MSKAPQGLFTKQYILYYVQCKTDILIVIEYTSKKFKSFKSCFKYSCKIGT